MKITADQIQENWNGLQEIIDGTFTDTRLENIKKLHNHFEDRMTLAPASGTKWFHNAFPGGYVAHVLNVIKWSLEYYEMFKKMGMHVDDLDEESLVEILTKPKNALVKQYQKLFAFENVKLEFTDDALTLIAKKAIERTTGARGLRSILENILLDTMYNLPGVEGVNEIVVNTEVIESNSKPLYIYDKSNKVINKKA